MTPMPLGCWTLTSPIAWAAKIPHGYGSAKCSFCASLTRKQENRGQVAIQSTGAPIAIAWPGAVSLGRFKLVDMAIGLRVTEEQEREGLDTASHGERAYNL
ncbi:MAG: hypothetical protein ACYC0P_02335 [Thiobacillus sp.]